MNFSREATAATEGFSEPYMDQGRDLRQAIKARRGRLCATTRKKNKIISVAERKEDGAMVKTQALFEV